MKISVIITAGGSSKRYGADNKLLEPLNGKTVIEHSVEQFLEFNEIIISANKSIIPELKSMFSEKIKIIEGGDNRQGSVYNGLKQCESDYVIIHDGARPLVSKEVINKTVQAVIEHQAVAVGVKTADTIKKVDKTGAVISTLDRSELYNIQTPQAFKTELIKKVHENLRGQNYTDDAGMVEALKGRVFVVEGEYRNIKITTKTDLLIAQTLMSE